MPKSITTAIIGIKNGTEIWVVSTQNPYFVGMAKQWQAEIEKLPVPGGLAEWFEDGKRWGAFRPELPR